MEELLLFHQRGCIKNHNMAVLATSIIRSQKSKSFLALITLLINQRICNTCISVLSELLLFSELCWNHLLFSELAWNISEFLYDFWVASCSIHFGVTLEDLEVDEKAQRRDWAFGGAAGQEELSGCGRVDLVEFFGRERPFQPGIGGMLNHCHGTYSLITSSLYFSLLMWYTAANIP